MANEKNDMNMNQFGYYPLFYMGAIFISFVIIYLFFNARKHIPEIATVSVLGGQKYNNNISVELFSKYYLY